MIKAFIRCNDGHFFVGETCPFDGWSSKESEELQAALVSLGKSNQKPSLSILKERGLSESTLNRVIIIEFAGNEGVFDAIEPRNYIVDGKAISHKNWPHH